MNYRDHPSPFELIEDTLSDDNQPRARHLALDIHEALTMWGYEIIRTSERTPLRCSRCGTSFAPDDDQDHLHQFGTVRCQRCYDREAGQRRTAVLD